jgi:cytoskeletal protein RodZ
VANGLAKQDRGTGRAFLTYNALRLALLAACLGLGWIAGLRSVLLIVAALLVSGVLSWFLLRPQREAMARAVEQTVARSRVRMEQRASAEDEYVETTHTQDSAVVAESTGGRVTTPADGDQSAS